MIIITNIIPYLVVAIIGLAAYLFVYQVSGFVKHYSLRLSGFFKRSGNIFKAADQIHLPVWLENASKLNKLEAKVKLAGLNPEWSAHRFAVLRIGTWIIGAVGAVLFLYSNQAATAIIILLAASYWPEVLLSQIIKRRKNYAEKTLSSVMDLLRLQAGIGLNLEESIKNIALTRKDLWKTEFEILNRNINSGLNISIALERMSMRFGIDDLQRFALAIKQAKFLGASLSDTLSIQSEQLKVRRRQKAEEQARLASVKITLPLVLCIFPALLVIYLAPAVITFLQ